MTTQQDERAELIRNLLSLLDDQMIDLEEDQKEIISKAAALLQADAEVGGEAAKFFLPPALHEGAAEHTIQPYRLYITGLTMRQIKEIFEDKFLGSMMWSNGSAYPTEGVEIRFTRPQQAAQVPAGHIVCLTCDGKGYQPIVDPALNEGRDQG